MRYLLIQLLLLANALFFVGVKTSFATETNQLTGAMIHGEVAILIDGTTGEVLYDKQSTAQLYPASITKIATGIYAIENGNPDDIVTVSHKARYEEGTRVYLGEGEQVPLRKLEYGLLMHSGNDAATAIAEHMSGTTEQFAEELNTFLREKVGVESTHFANAHGLHDPNHYTTASDMAKIARYAMKNEIFRQIVSTKQLKWDGREWKSQLVNHNKMLWRYEGATGIKNGFTDQARHTLVVSAKRGDTEFIAVTMKAHSSEMAYDDVTSLLDYGFTRYETKKVADAGQTFTLATDATNKQEDQYFTGEDLYVTVPLGASLQSKVSDGMLQIHAGEIDKTFPLIRKEGKLTKKDNTPHPSNAAVQEGPSIARYLIMLAWGTLILLMVLYIVLRTKRRRRRSTQQELRKRTG